MKTLLLTGALTALRLLLSVSPAHAQASGSLPLPELLALGRNLVPDSARLMAQLAAKLPAADWAYGGRVAGTPDFFWTSTIAAPGQPPIYWLCLRPAQPTHDVVLKTTVGEYVRQLRRALAQRKLQPEVVTSLDGEAVRYQAPDFVLTLYSHKRGDYPFVVVLRQSVVAGGAPTTRIP